VAGDYRGTWTDSEGNSGEIVISIVQDNTSLSGTASVSDSECISTGNVTGTITPSTNRLNLTITAGADRVSFNAAFDTNTKAMDGSFNFEAGACAGDTGDFSMTLTGGADVSW
jgi:hypothetical protein